MNHVDWQFLLWLLVQPVEGGGYGYSWPDAIRMGPRQILFVTQSEAVAKRNGTLRNMRINGKSPDDMMRDAKAAIAARRRQFTGTENRDEL